MPSSLSNLYQPLLANNNINISNIPLWKSWVKTVTVITFSSMVSIITAPIVAITNYWKETTKFEFVDGWNNFIMNPLIFISSELINSFFYTLAFFKIEFCLDTLFTNNLSWKDKAITITKNSTLVMSLIFINEVSKNIIYNTLNSEKIWISLSEDFIFNLGKETVIVIAWKIFKMCFTNNSSFRNYVNSTLIITLLAIGYVVANIGQTLYIIRNTSISNFLTNFPVIFTSNTITGGFRIVSSSLLTAFFADIANKWKNSCCQKSLVNDADLLQETQEVVVTDNSSYGTFADATRGVNNDLCSINNDILLIEEVNSSDKCSPNLANTKKNVMNH